MLERFLNTPDETLTVGRPESNEQDPVVRSWNKLSKVRKVQVLCDQESRVSLRRLPNVAVAIATQILLPNCVNVVVETRQD